MSQAPTPAIDESIEPTKPQPAQSGFPASVLCYQAQVRRQDR